MPGILNSLNHTRRIILIIWWLSLIVNLVIVFYLIADEWIGHDYFYNLVENLSALYTPYLTLLITFYIGRRSDSDRSDEALSTTGNVVAVLGSLLWNLMILFFTIGLFLEMGTVEDTLEFFRRMGSFFSVLVSIALGYYFAKSPQPSSS